MATLIIFNDFVEQVAKGLHQFGTHTFKWALTNTAPNASTGAVFGDISEIAAGNGYSAGGATATFAVSETSGTAIIGGTSSSATFSASGGDIATFRYAVLYNSSVSSPLNQPLVGYADYGSAVTVTSGNIFEISVSVAGVLQYAKA